MLTLEVQARIHRPVHEVFAFLADFTHMPLWNYYVQSVTQVTPGPPGVGTVYDQVRRSDRQRYAITECVPNQQVAVRTLPPARPWTLRFCVLPAEPSDEGGGARVTETWDLDTGLPGPLERLAQPPVRAAVAANLAVLTTLLGTVEARLPDGRDVRLAMHAGK